MSDLLKRLDYQFSLSWISRLPLPLAYRFAKWRGTWFYRTRKESRRHAIKNIIQALPSISEVEAREIARRHYQTLSVDEMESFWFERNAEFFRRHVVIDGLDQLKQASGRQGGAILMIGHWGSPGILIVAIGKHGIPFHVAVRPIERDEDSLDTAQLSYGKQRLKDIEQAIGRPILYTGRGNFPRMKELLRSGELLMLQIDVTPNILKHVQPAQFFGRTAYFADGIVRLQRETGARLFHCLILQSRQMPCQRIEIREVNTSLFEEDRALLQHLVSMLEEEIRKRPYAWTLWDSMEWFYIPPREQA